MDVNGVVENCFDRDGSPGEDSRSYSSVLNDNPPGTGYARSTLGSDAAWKAAKDQDPA